MMRKPHTPPHLLPWQAHIHMLRAGHVQDKKSALEETACWPKALSQPYPLVTAIIDRQYHRPAIFHDTCSCLDHAYISRRHVLRQAQ
jgi:hypothetical protein